MARKVKHLKKKPLVLICAEGGSNSTEFKYLKRFSCRDLRIKCCSGNDTDVNGMVANLINYIDKEDIKNEDNCKIFLMIDADLSKKRIKQIQSIEKQCKRHNIEIITSSPTLEIWFLLHFRKDKLNFDNSLGVKNELNKVKTKYGLSNEDSFYTFLLNKNNIASAIENAKSLLVVENDVSIYFSNPHTMIYKIIEAINFLK